MMIAYDHLIKFTPSLKSDKKLDSSYSEEITVEKSMLSDLHEKLRYQLKFINNQGRDLMLYAGGEFSPTKKDQLWAFEVKGIVTFYWYSATKTLHYITNDNFKEALLEYWTLHIVLPVFFTIEEKFDFLHAGAVEVEGKPVLFVAESFGGKSTMTDFFMKQGHAMISDDKVATYEENGVFFAVPSHPHHRPHRGMEDLGFFVENVAKEPKPIHAIYELVRSDAKAKIVIEQIHGIEKFKSLCYSSEINLSFLKAKRFGFLSRLAKVVPVYKVTVPWDLDRLDEVYKAIVVKSTEE